MQSCLEPFGQHSIEFPAVQCYLKGIKTTLDRIFSYAMLSGAFRAMYIYIYICIYVYIYIYNIYRYIYIQYT